MKWQVSQADPSLLLVLQQELSFPDSLTDEWVMLYFQRLYGRSGRRLC